MKLYNHEINPHSDVSIGNQIKEILQKEIAAGRWNDGERLPTAREISHLVGVSSTTASKALAGLAEDGSVRRHVGQGSFLRASERIQRRRTGVIGIVQGVSLIPGYAISSRLPYYHSLVEQMDAELSKWEFKSQLFHEHSLKQIEGDGDQAFIDASKLHSVDGLLNLGALPISFHQEIQSKHIPVVCVGTEEAPAGVPYIGVDDRHEIWEAVDHLVQTRHRRVGLIHAFPDTNLRRIQSRLGAFVGACLEAGIPAREDWILNMGPDNGGQLRLVKEFLASGDAPSAVICTSAQAAKAVYEISSLLEIHIPQELSVICLTPVPQFGEDYNPPVSTLVADIPAVARHAVQVLLEMIRTGRAPVCAGNLIRSIWTPRASVACPKF